MVKVGLLKIGFIERDQVNAIYINPNASQNQQQVNDRGAVDNVQWLKNIDQQNSSISEEFETDERGAQYSVSVDFVVRTEKDITLTKRFIRRPIVLYVQTVDGRQITVGTVEYPAFLKTANKYRAVSSRELSCELEYKSLMPTL